MTTHLKTSRSLAAVLAVMVLCVGCARGPVIDVAPLVAPAADTVRVYDRTSDDGSAIIIEWAKPADQPDDNASDEQDTEQEEADTTDDSPEQAEDSPEQDSLSPEHREKLYVLITELVRDDTITGAEVQLARTALDEIDAARQEGLESEVHYVIEVARSRKDFAASEKKKYREVFVHPSEDTLKSADPQYFGFSADNANCYYAAIVPAELFKPAPPRLLSAELAKLADDPGQPDLALDALTDARLRLLAATGVLTEKEAERAIATSDIDVPVTASDIDALASQALAELCTLLTDAVQDGAIDDGEVEGIRTGIEDVHDLAAKHSPREDAELAWLDGLKLYLRVVQLHADGAVTESEVRRARAALAVVDAVAKTEAELAAELIARQQSQPADADEAGAMSPRQQAEQSLSPKDRGDLNWFARLGAWVTKRDQKAEKSAAREINAGTFYFRLAAVRGQEKVYVVSDGEKVVFAGQAKTNSFKWFKLNSLLFALIFSAVVIAFIQIAKRKPNLFIRRIAGLEAVEEAIGRATEMGRSVYFVHGLGGMGGMATIAAINVLGRVARRSAEYDTRVQVMNINPIVTAVSQEVVQQAYTEAGRPDAFDPDDVAYVAAGQFSYAAAVAGRMMREKPAAIFLMGSFMAESLLLSESGAATGAIQVAGTDAYHQLPFFVTTCDYTLIGEELYAASAYLSREPRLLGSIRGQDVGKAFMMLVILIGVVALTIAVALGKDLSWIRNIFQVF